MVAPIIYRKYTYALKISFDYSILKSDSNRKKWTIGRRMNWYLIYQKEDIEYNRAYIDMYFRSSAKRNIHLELITPDVFLGAPEMPVKGFGTDAVINRSRDVNLALTCERLNIPVFNNSQICRLGNDKLAAVSYAKEKGIRVMPTYVDPDRLDFPFVMKSRDGHGGKEVFLIENEQDLDSVRAMTEPENIVLNNLPDQKEPGEGGVNNGFVSLSDIEDNRWVYQKLASDTGKDLRVYITGNKITAAMLRSSQNDFRSNFSLGGSASVYTLSAEEKEMVTRLTEGLDIGHCGIDFIFDNGEPVFNEIEDVVGSRMLYKYTDIDVVEEYVEYINKILLS